MSAFKREFKTSSGSPAFDLTRFFREYNMIHCNSANCNSLKMAKDKMLAPIIIPFFQLARDEHLS